MPSTTTVVSSVAAGLLLVAAIFVVMDHGSQPTPGVARVSSTTQMDSANEDVAAKSQFLDSSGRPTVSIPGVGTVKGKLDAPGIDAFLGIPFAKPPTGDLRWQPPVSHPGWLLDPLSTTNYKPACPQDPGLPGNQKEQSEDCLYLNVATPRGGRNLPVMLWIHGGGNSGGSTYEAAYNLTSLVEASGNSVVVVSVEYRVAAFGFLGSSELRAATRDSSTGNYGVLDQRLAMQWVKDNIAAFGGNGNDITLFGESAGAYDIAWHLTNSASYGLYSKVIMQSYGNSGLEAISLSRAEGIYQQMLENAGCKNLTCLKAASVETILNASPQTAMWNPVVDAVHTRATPYELFARHEFNPVPMIIGSNHDENSIVQHGNSAGMPGTPWNLTEQGFDELLQTLPVSPRLSPTEIDYVKSLYTSANYNDYPADLGQYSKHWWANMMIHTDCCQPASTGHCTSRWFAQQAASKSPAVYMYLFAHPPQYKTLEALYDWFGPDNILAPHGAELNYVFNSFHEGDSASTTDRAVGRDMAAAWASFATSGAPHKGFEEWQQYTREGDRVLYIEPSVDSYDGATMKSGLRKAQCDFWDSRPSDLWVLNSL